MVIRFGTNRQPIVINTNFPPILHRFQVMADYCQIFASDRRVPHFNALAGGDPREYPVNFTSRETRIIVLPDAKTA